MNLILLAAVSTLTFGSAQDASVQPAASQSPPAAEAETQSPAEAACEARAEAFGARMDTMQPALQAVLSDPSTDKAGKMAAADAVIDGYVPDIETFATELEAFIRSQADLPENAEQRENMLQAAAAAPTAIRGIPEQVRAGIRASLEAPAAPPEAEPEASPQR